MFSKSNNFPVINPKRIECLAGVSLTTAVTFKCVWNFHICRIHKKKEMILVEWTCSLTQAQARILATTMMTLSWSVMCWCVCVLKSFIFQVREVFETSWYFFFFFVPIVIDLWECTWTIRVLAIFSLSSFDDKHFMSFMFMSDAQQ